jgi:hypothetical protein
MSKRNKINKKYDYYADPEYRKKHNEYMSVVVKCECGRDIRRSSMSVHRKSALHNRIIQRKEEYCIDKYKNKILKRLKSYTKDLLTSEQIHKLIKIINSI